MKIIKRNGAEEVFDINKVVNAIAKANNAGDKNELTEGQIADIADYIEYKCGKVGRAVSVEEIQDMSRVRSWQRAHSTLRAAM